MGHYNGRDSTGGHSSSRARWPPNTTGLITAEDLTRGKPHPEGYLAAAGRLDVRAQDCIVVEDAPAGIEAAHAAGMRVIALATTHSRNRLETADWGVESLSRLRVTATPAGLQLHLEDPFWPNETL